ncbi:MAG: tetratricopeptide repeat protein, partial [Patescibacteria group bacterium]
SVALNPNDVRNHVNVARVYQSVLPFANDAEQLGVGSYTKAVELDPTNPVARFDLARLYLDSAVLHKRRATAKDVTDEVKKSEEEKLKAALAEAEKYLDETLELKPDFAPAYLHKATIMSERGNKEEALKLLDAALVVNARLAQLSSADEGLFYLTGLAYASLNEKDRASNAFRAAFTLRPNYQLALWNYSILQLDKGNKDEAIRALEQILQYDPENKTVKDQLEKIKSGAADKPAEEKKEE